MEVQFPEEPRFLAWKIPFLQYMIAIILLVLLAGYWRLQVTHHKKYIELSERNRTRDLPIIAPRGRILDRNGHVLVDNRPAFSVLLSRDEPGKLAPDEIEKIAQGLGLDPADLTQQLQQAQNLPRFQPLVIKESASIEDVAFVESHRSEYPELDLIQVPQRFYPKHHIASAMLGYVGDVSAETIARTGRKYQPGDVVGKTGIEREYNTSLAGKDGVRRVVVNSRGQEMGTLATLDPKPGHDLRLTIDLNLQLTAEQELGSQDGAVVALDPRTGQVLTMVSQPAFDPNQFAHHIDAQEWKQLVSDPAKPLMNKAIQAQLAPGSIFKIVTSVAALETGTVRPNYTVHCPGYVTFYGHTYHDWSWWSHRRGHGTVDLHEAIVHSCDVYFYTVGKMLGIDKLAYFAKHLGLGARTGIDLPGEEPGVVPTPAWVEKYFRHKWYAGETISVAIGQGAVAVTPLQVAYMIGGVASGGVFYRPHLVFHDELQRLGLGPQRNNPRVFPLSPTTVAAVDRGMWGVVNEGGTGARAHVVGLDIAGKTGTAQVVSVRLQHAAHSGNYKDNAWFVGFAPSTHPEIVVAVLVMHGGHSSVAVPIASAVIKAYYAEKHPQQVPLTQPGREPEIAKGAGSQPSTPAVKASVIP